MSDSTPVPRARRPRSGERHTLTYVDPEARVGTCAICGPVKLKPKNTPRGVRFRCMISYKKNNETSRRKGSRARNLRIKYGITTDEYERMYEHQTGRCAICKVEESVLYIDHDHSTGVVRGLLCRACNLAIGLLHDNQTLVLAAARYLKLADGAMLPPSAGIPRQPRDAAEG